MTAMLEPYKAISNIHMLALHILQQSGRQWRDIDEVKSTRGGGAKPATRSICYTTKSIGRKFNIFKTLPKFALCDLKGADRPGKWTQLHSSQRGHNPQVVLRYKIVSLGPNQFNRLYNSLKAQTTVLQ